MTPETAEARARFTAPPLLPAPTGIMRGDGAEINLTPHPHAAPPKPPAPYFKNGLGENVKRDSAMLRKLAWSNEQC